MVVDRGGSTRLCPDGEPWRVRIRDSEGFVLGAGMLVCTGQVLTCAHVVSSDNGETVPDKKTPDKKVVVEFVGLPGVPSVAATVAEDGWIPPRADNGGDVALLDLADGVRAPSTAPLRRLPVSWDREVRTFGYPDGAEETGVHTRAILAGPADRGSEWVQMDARIAGNPVSRGFSGAAVVDHRSGYVIGMTVSQYTRDMSGVSWMLPVETILRHLPRIKCCVSGDAAVDREFTTVRPDSRINVGVAEKITWWFTRKHGPTGTVLLIVTGGPDSGESNALRSVVGLADRESGRSGTDRAPFEPPIGSVDLALDATGRTTGEVVDRIAGRLAIEPDEQTDMTGLVRAEAPPMTLVVDGVDAAAEPEALVTEVLAPLASRGLRLLLGFHSRESTAFRIAGSLWPNQEPQGHDPLDPEVISGRIDALATRIADIADRENAVRRHRAHVAARIASVPDVPAVAMKLRLRLSALRGHDTSPSELDAVEDAAERALSRLTQCYERLDRMLSRRDELRGRLAAFQARAVDWGLAEDVGLDEVFRRAHASLWQGACDLVAADRLVRGYESAVRAKGDGTRR